MATYLQGVTDYIPQVQPWAPNFNFYQSAFDKKQNKFDQGWNKLNTIYNGILNAPMMREDNNLKRDEFFNNIKTQIDQMAGMDLSLQQNVTAASQVFKPFYEDEEIVHDIGFTKKYSDEMQKADYFKNCTDKEKCGDQYWSGGVRALQYKAQDFMEANAEDALRMQAPSYTPYANFMEEATKVAKEADVNIEYDSIQGGYRVTTKNGEKLKPKLMDFFMARLGDNPKLKDFYKTKAFLLGRENPEEALNIYEYSMMQSKATTQEELDAMVKEKTSQANYSGASKVIGQTKAKQDANVSNLSRRRAIIEENIKNKGMVIGGAKEKALAQLTQAEADANATKGIIDGMAEITGKRPYIDDEGNKVSQDVIDNTVANAMMMRDMGLAANTLAYKDYKVSMKADPYALARYKHGMDMEKTMYVQNAKDERAYTKDIYDQGAAYKKVLLDKGYIDILSDKPYYINPATQKMDYIQGGGMATGDAADKAALMRQMKTDGTYQGRKHFEAVWADKTSGAGTREGITVDMSTTEAGSEPSRLASIYNLLVSDVPGANMVSQGTPEESFSDPNFIGPLDGTLNTSAKKTSDVRVPIAIYKTKQGEMTASAFKKEVDEFTGDLMQYADQMLDASNKVQTRTTQSRIKALAIMAGEGDKKAIDVMVNLGNAVKGNLKHNRSIIDKANFSEEAMAMFETMPNATSNSENANAEWFRKFSTLEPSDMVALMGGTREVYELISNDAQKVYTESYNNSEMIDRNEVPIISDEKYKNYANREQDIKALKFIASNVATHGRKFYKSRPEDLAFYDENFEKLEPLTKEQQEQVKEYEWYTSQPSYDNGLKDLGFNTTIPYLVNLNKNEIEEMHLAEWAYQAGTKMKSNFSNAMNGAFESFGMRTEHESPWYNSDTETPASFVNSFIANRVWDKDAKNGLGGLTPADDIYIAALKNKAHTWNIFDGYFGNNPSDIGQDYTLTIPQLETDYMGGRPAINGKALVNILMDSELIETEPPALTEEGDLMLSQWESEGGADAVKNSLVQPEGAWGDVLVNNPWSNYMDNQNSWRLLLSHPETTIKRDDNIAQISNPSVLGGNTHSVKLDEYEAYRGYENMFGKIYDSLGKVRAEFIDHAQNTPAGTNSTVLPSTYFEDVSGNFAIASPGISSIVVEAGLHNRAEAEVMPLIQELYGSIEDDLTEYGIAGHDSNFSRTKQGNPQLLHLLNTTFTDKAEFEEDATKRPSFTVNIDPTFKHTDLTRVVVELGSGKDKWLKGSDEFRKWVGGNVQEVQWPINPKQTYYIQKSNSDIIRKMKPNPQTVLLGLADGGKYEDDFYYNELRSKTSYSRNGNQINITRTVNLYNPDTKDYEPVTIPIGNYPLFGTDWQEVIKIEQDAAFRLPYENANILAEQELVYKAYGQN